MSWYEVKDPKVRGQKAQLRGLPTTATTQIGDRGARRGQRRAGIGGQVMQCTVQ
ncbi:hypothetical protein MGG_16330 [Pyricularia oryzae 70-15]|uniref:Uncharacterized protein n=1 Tax=Pyricularia oryzae (strain 70-15 / ATCC MYA-4617 / FGSC 8958) TaxID=242507 RepID=G4MKI1_PYRO7|nr:uncharacterized protein MGG_16330 [Pyricularia oryzae 70-15]EHA57570.1 hypothetical protein MGG_16330 [Pyricularia oryzae 70-15]